VSGATTAPGESEALRRRVEEAVGAIFDIEEEIGRGGMAVVYRALDKRLRRKVALKVLPPDLAFRADVRSRFVREAQMAAQLSHAHIVPIFAVDETGGIVYFAMGLVEGDTLAKELATQPRPDVQTVRRILREVADGLAYAHARGVVHRDVKPDNILIERASGRALVSDFGIARAAEGDLRLTVTGVAVGTPAYMSPEQAMGEKDVDGRADIYALGVVGWQMLAGELPFHSENTPGMLMKHISEPPRALSSMRSGLPDNLVYAIERAMAKGRNDRWADALAFRDALDENAPAPPQGFSNAHTPPGHVPAWRAPPPRAGGAPPPQQRQAATRARRGWRTAAHSRGEPGLGGRGRAAGTVVVKALALRSPARTRAADRLRCGGPARVARTAKGVARAEQAVERDRGRAPLVPRASGTTPRSARAAARRPAGCS
jgi:serine/threonine protein kinase